MATALRPDTRRVAEATPAAITAAFLFEAAVCAATARTGVEAGAAAGGALTAAASIGGDKVDGAGGNISATAARNKKRKKKRPQQLAPLSTTSLSHSLALAAGKLSRSSGAPLPRGASHALCSRCGNVLGAGGRDEIAVRPVSRSCRRRRRRAAAAAAAAAAGAGATTAQPSSSSRRGKNLSTAATSSSKELNTVVLAVTCGSCGQAKRARGFYTRELAEAAAAALRRGGGGGG